MCHPYNKLNKIDKTNIFKKIAKKEFIKFENVENKIDDFDY